MSQTHISNLKKKPSSVCTMATSHALKDLKIFIYSLRLFEETIPIYILCDTETQKGLERFKNDDNIFIYPNLDKYSNKNRQQMRKWEFGLNLC